LLGYQPPRSRQHVTLAPRRSGLGGLLGRLAAALVYLRTGGGDRGAY
jgi:hypothetical protein